MGRLYLRGGKMAGAGRLHSPSAERRMGRIAPKSGRSASPQLREILLPEFLGAAAVGPAGGFGGAQFDAADLARNRLRQFGEFETAHALERRKMGAQMAEDRQGRVAVGSVVHGKRDKSLGHGDETWATGDLQ